MRKKFLALSVAAAALTYVQQAQGIQIKLGSLQQKGLTQGLSSKEKILSQEDSNGKPVPLKEEEEVKYSLKDIMGIVQKIKAEQDKSKESNEEKEVEDKKWEEKRRLRREGRERKRREKRDRKMAKKKMQSRSPSTDKNSRSTSLDKDASATIQSPQILNTELLNKNIKEDKNDLESPLQKSIPPVVVQQSNVQIDQGQPMVQEAVKNDESQPLQSVSEDTQNTNQDALPPAEPTDPIPSDTPPVSDENFNPQNVSVVIQSPEHLIIIDPKDQICIPVTINEQPKQDQSQGSRDENNSHQTIDAPIEAQDQPTNESAEVQEPETSMVEASATPSEEVVPIVSNDSASDFASLLLSANNITEATNITGKGDSTNKDVVVIPLSKSVATDQQHILDKNLTLNTTVTTVMTRVISSPLGDETTVTKVIETHPDEHTSSSVISSETYGCFVVPKNSSESAENSQQNSTQNVEKSDQNSKELIKAGDDVEQMIEIVEEVEVPDDEDPIEKANVTPKNIPNVVGVQEKQ